MATCGRGCANWRSNVVGNAVAAVVIAKWEGELDPLQPAEIEPRPAPAHRPPLPPGVDDSFPT